MVRACTSLVERWWRTGTVDVVGVDVSGRHEEAGEYLMVAAAVHAAVGSDCIRGIRGMGFATSTAEPTLEAVADVVADAVDDLPEPPEGAIVSERGEFYGESDWQVAQHLEREFKYVESIGERETVQAAHHAAYAARNLLL